MQSMQYYTKWIQTNNYDIIASEQKDWYLKIAVYIHENYYWIFKLFATEYSYNFLFFY